jgi:hypothetical protein
MEEAPNSWLVNYIMIRVWTQAQAESYVVLYGPPAQRMTRAELRINLGHTTYPAPIYRHRVSLVAFSLYVAGHQRTPRDVVYTLMSEGTYPLQPIQLQLRWWTLEEQQLIAALL